MIITRADTHCSRRRRAAITAALALSALLLALIAPAAALAASLWHEGTTGSPFHLASTGGTVIGGSPSDQSITLPFVMAWMTSAPVAPWSVVPMGDGTTSMLVAEPDAGVLGQVRIVDRSGSGSPITIKGETLNRPRWASSTHDGTTLIADTNNDRVLEVDSAGKLVKPYDGGRNGMNQPGSAFRTVTGTTLVADTNHHRVVELKSDGSQTEYGGSGRLSFPGCVIRLKDGPTLIADTGNSRLVIIGAVDPLQTPTVIGSSVLNQPTSVFQTDSGTLLVADTGNNRVVEMDLGGRILSVMNAGLSGPTAAARLPDGSTAIAYGPSGSRLLQGQGPGGNSATAVSSPLDFGLPGVTKKLKSISPPNVSGIGVALSYRLNGSKTWKSFPKRGVFSPAASFTTIEYKVTLTGSGTGVPTLFDLAFNWDYVPAPTATGGTPFGTGLGTGFGPGTGFGTPGGSYVGTGTAVPEALFDNGVRRGWVMESVGTFGTGKLPGPGGVAAQPVTKKQVAGLALLGGMWGIGIALQPIGKLLLALRGMLPFGVISGR